jgi:hypothetical protein
MFFHKFSDIFYCKIFEYTSFAGIIKISGLITFEVVKQCFFLIQKFTQNSIIRNEDVSWGVEVEIVVQHDVEAT